MSQVHVSTEKVSTMKLPLPEGVEVVHAVSAVGHLSSSSIYPACLAPYVIVTACSGNVLFLFFFDCKLNEAVLVIAFRLVVCCQPFTQILIIFSYKLEII